MFTVKINIEPVVNLLKEKIEKLEDKDYLLRPVAFDLIDLMTKRIHIDGLASDGADIGTYSKRYLLRRIKFKRGKAIAPVIVSLTRQLENDWSVIATNTGYGIGFKNVYNYKKARWVEEIKKRIIFNLTQEEENYAIKKINQLVSDALK